VRFILIHCRLKLRQAFSLGGWVLSSWLTVKESQLIFSFVSSS